MRSSFWECGGDGEERVPGKAVYSLIRARRAQRVPDVRFHRAFAKHQPLRDREIGEPLGNQLDDFALALAQRIPGRGLGGVLTLL